MRRSPTAGPAIPLWIAAMLCCAPGRADVQINEIMYNSPATPDVEFVELYNSGPAPVDVSGWTLLDSDDSNDRCALSGSIPAGGFLIVAGRLDLFATTYPQAGPLNPAPFDSTQVDVGFGLGNTADSVRLFDASETLVDRVNYQSGGAWPADADGDGASLELINPALDNSQASSWAASVANLGTPGELNSTFLANPPPQLGNIRRDLDLPDVDDVVTVTADVTDTDTPLVELWVDAGNGFHPRPMFDDGSNGDADANDGEYSARIVPRDYPTRRWRQRLGRSAGPAEGTLVRYYVTATDTSPQTVTAPDGAPGNYLAYTLGYRPPVLRINEILASNQNGLFDEFGDRDDWVELRNPGPDAVDLEGMFLTDDPNDSMRWEFPPFILGPGQTALVWCDEEPGQGALHATFRLPRGGGRVALFDRIDGGNTRIDRLRFGPQNPDVSFGYYPDDADAAEYLATPTPLNPNIGAQLWSTIVINEFLAASQIPGAADWIELTNRGAFPVDIGGWHITDDPALVDRYTFPAPLPLPPGGFVSVDSNTLGFGLSGGGEQILLSAADAVTARDYHDFGDQLSDVSRGRLPDGQANWHSFSPPSRDAANACDPSIETPGALEELRFESRTALGWSAQPGRLYDVVSGTLHGLRTSGGDFSSAVDSCVENNSPDARSYDPRTPAAGDARFYLVRGVNDACGFGTFDPPGGGPTASRDAEIDAATASCP